MTPSAIVDRVVAHQDRVALEAVRIARRRLISFSAAHRRDPQASVGPQSGLWRPVPRHAMTNRLIDLRMVHLSCDRAFAAAAFGVLLGLSGVLFLARPVTSQLATDRGPTAFQGPCDLHLIGSSIPQLRYAVSLFHRKITRHRWASVAKGVTPLHVTHLATAQRCFLLRQFQHLDCVWLFRPPSLFSHYR